MNGFIGSARRKIGVLICRNDFSSISSIEHNVVKIEFKNGKSCTVDVWGRVIWTYKNAQDLVDDND